MNLTFTILGCGSSMGVPRVALGWGVCDPNNPKIDGDDARCWWNAAMLRDSEHAFSSTARPIFACNCWTLRLTGSMAYSSRMNMPTTRMASMICARYSSTDAVDLRSTWMSRPHERWRPVLAIASPPRPAANIRRLQSKNAWYAGYPVTIDGQGGPIEVMPVLQDHGDIPSLGFRFGNVAYSADIKSLPAESVAALGGLDVWIVDALRKAPHPSHFNLDEALEWIARINPKRAILTNLHSDMDYAALRAELPPTVEPAYDLMSFVAP